MAKYPEASQLIGAGNDQEDAELAFALLVCHPERFGPLRPQSAAMQAQESMWNVSGHGLVTRSGCPIGFALRSSSIAPQALEWFDDWSTVLFCDVVDRWPRPVRIDLRGGTAD